jgi:hypothetical protein
LGYNDLEFSGGLLPRWAIGSWEVGDGGRVSTWVRELTEATMVAVVGPRSGVFDMGELGSIGSLHLQGGGLLGSG